MNEQREQVSENTKEVTKKTYTTIVHIIVTVFNFIIGILKGFYDAINDLTNNLINNILFYLLGTVLILNVLSIVVIPTVIKEESLSLLEALVSICLGGLIFFIKYKLFKAVEKYRYNRIGYKGHSVVSRILLYIVLIYVIIFLIIVLYSFVMLYQSIEA